MNRRAINILQAALSHASMTAYFGMHFPSSTVNNMAMPFTGLAQTSKIQLFI